MSQEPAYTSDDLEELLDLASSNAQAILLGTAAFLAEKAIPLDEWTEFLGQAFARSWGEPEPWAAGEFLDAMLTNYRSVGASVIEATLDPERAAARITGFPNPELCEDLEIECGLLDVYFTLPASLAADRGLIWEWTREELDVQFTVTRRDG